MLYPSIDKLMNVIDSKYSLVTISARRARNFQEEENPKMEKYRSHKYVGKALEEIYGGIIKLKKTEEDKA
ncbi:DNA-directed RNA polymerase subunit omega [Bacillus sp. FJAT-49711]|uniref:DNA-directed RNA polymerase subunit omega n=1 Tax=Bacillus sp. FJAT-49711 TaxID=2833585 RepID=UPI001BC951CE|nr:DNA-directed RNA polymerase subunit omega [Bacillus sp. FJAT-49711]MBS4217804.1 DNA-directed RNA polymerase subunit omega [Bacillus sp. FJAT-49711]